MSDSAAENGFIKVLSLGGFLAVRQKTPRFHQVIDTPAFLQPNSTSVIESSRATSLLLSDCALQL